MLEHQVASLTISESINIDEDIQMYERITTPRKGPFSTEECIYLSERFPRTELHQSLFAHKGSHMLPPVFYRGWIIDEKDFWARALDKGVAVFFDDDEDKVTDERDYYTSVNGYVRSVLSEVEVNPPVTTYVNLVFGPKDFHGRIRFHLSVQDNYHVDEMLSEKEVVKLGKAFGITEEPRWYISAMDTRWRFKSK